MSTPRVVTSLTALALGSAALVGFVGTSSASAAEARVPYCQASQIKVTTTTVTGPSDRLLIAAQNVSGKPCDLGIIGDVTFDGKIRAELPDGIGGGPNILRPGDSNYEAVTLAHRYTPGSIVRTGTVTLGLEGGDTITIPAAVTVDSPFVNSPWQDTAEHALSTH
ncbi:hypothetical protein [Streptomyces sp. NPDC037389]|uniref:hypothetical protein n=1 Tax=Streptomyces sp. NPDC037389 TaxID=3155369 RepID=UPI0033CCB9B0